MELSLEHTAVMAWLAVRTPVLCLLSIAQPRALAARNRNSGLQLRCLNLFWPAFDHPDALVNDEFFAHCEKRLDLMADGAHRERGYRVEKGGVVAVHYYAGCPSGQSRKNVLAVGGGCVLIHQLNAN